MTTDSSLRTLVLPGAPSCSYNDLDQLTALPWKNSSNEVLRSRGYGYTMAAMIERADTEDGGQ